MAIELDPILSNLVSNLNHACYVGLTILCIIFLTFSLNDKIFHIIMSVPHNIVMNLNNVSGVRLIKKWGSGV